MSPILEPLAPFRQHLTIVSGLRNKPGETPEPHGYIEMTWLSCVKPWDHGVAGPDSGVSADQLAARHIGQDTRLPSLELTTAHRRRAAGLADADAVAAAGRQSRARCFRSCSARATPTRNARRFSRRPAASWIASRDRRRGCRPASAFSDRVVVSDYLDSVREIERRVQMASQAGHVARWRFRMRRSARRTTSPSISS